MLPIRLAMRASPHEFSRTAALARIAMIGVLATMLAGAWRAARATELPEEVNQYADAIAGIEKARGRHSLQTAFELGIKASPHVMAVIDPLSDAEFKSLQAKMPGFVMSRGEFAMVRPSANFFSKLARRKGTKADRAFFDMYGKSEPDTGPGVPAWIRQQTDETGCTLFDGPLLVGLYRGWLAYRTEFPDDYATEAQGELDSLDAELTAGTCACGSKEQVLAAFDTFAKALPDVPISAKVRERAARIRSGTSHIRFNCKSG
jgi:hypothetical protein